MPVSRVSRRSRSQSYGNRLQIHHVLKKAVHNPDCYTLEMVIINEMIGPKSKPIRKVYIKSDLITGYVRLGVFDNIPYQVMVLQMGNDLVCDKVMALPYGFTLSP